MAWHETPSDTFVARHDERDAEDAAQVLRTLEGARVRLQRLLTTTVGDLDVVLHGTEAQLDAAAPLAAVQRRLTAPAGRRYVVGWTSERELHMLSPRVLARRASNVEGSLEMLMLSPTALLARRIVAEGNDRFRPNVGPRMLARYGRWAWLLEGAAQYFSGQTHYAKPVIARRLREGDPPAFPPARADATMLGGSIFDLVAREEGEAAAIAMACNSEHSPRDVLERAFAGRSMRRTEDAWRAHVARMAEGRALPKRSTSAR